MKHQLVNRRTSHRGLIGKDTLLDLTLGIYEPECRYLQAVTFSEMSTRGRFCVPNTVYAVKGRKFHLNAVEVVIVYEQIMYVTLANMFINQSSLANRIAVDNFFPTVVDEKILIVGLDANFNKIVDHEDFEASFSVQDRVDKESGSVWMDTLLDVNSGAHTMKVKLYVDLR